MNEKRSHLNLLGELFGCDIGLYPAHLATLNLAAREINDEANYPRIDRKDFFDFGPGQPFCHIPIHASGKKTAVMLPELDAVVGNPPYVRQEKVDKARKPHLATLMHEAFKGTKLSGRADLHCYFWPHAARFLREGGAFGFLTSSQWLDVDYGFALQGWMLKHFRIVAILESAAERWFPDARVKTCIAILVRCGDEAARRQNPVRFVRLEKPLAEIIGVPATGGVGPEAEAGERLRQQAVDRIRDAIEGITRNVHDDRWRVMVKRQGDLWDEGVRAGQVLKHAPVPETPDDDDEDDDTVDAEPDDDLLAAAAGGEYAAGKWGRYLRAPDLYFEILERFRDKFVPLGSIVDIRRGITSGCDAFFMPKDVTDKVLADNPDDKDFRTATGVARRDVVSGKLKIIQDGAKVLHPIEPEYIKPEVHSLMKVHRPVVQDEDLHQVILLIGGDLQQYEGTHAYRYVKYGEIATYQSTKSKPVPVPERATCAARERWYDLMGLVKPGFAFWPKSQQYRHIIPANPHRIISNCNLYDLAACELSMDEQTVLTGILNSTLIGLFKTFYGRYAGTEGNLKTEVVDVNLIDVVDPRKAPKTIVKRFASPLKSMCARDVGGLVEDSLMDCHSHDLARKIAAGPVVHSTELQHADRRELDDAVFELLGVADAAERRGLIDRLYDATAEHFRAIRVTEIQKMEDRKKGTGSKFAVADQAADAWDSLTLADRTPLAEWLLARRTAACEDITIPSERPVQYDGNSLTESETVYFGKTRKQFVVCESRGQAELLARVAELGVTGSVFVPKLQKAARELLAAVEARHDAAVEQLRDMASRRTGEGEAQEQIFKMLERWFVLGQPAKR